MPPKRKKSVRQKQKQRQSQSQKVIVNIGKTTTTKRRRNAGRGGLPPPSYQQNLAPTFVTAPQVDYVGLIGEISRLTAKVQDPVPIRNPVTPLHATLQATNAEAQQMAGIKAEERRAGPTAENFQAPPSIASTDSQDLEGFEVGPQRSETASMPFSMREDLVREPPPVLLPRPRVVKKLEGTMKSKIEELKQSLANRPPSTNIPPSPAFNPEAVFGELRPGDEYITQQLVSDKKPPNMGDVGPEGGGGVEPSLEEIQRRKEQEKKEKAKEASRRQQDKYRPIREKMKRKEPLTEEEKKITQEAGFRMSKKQTEEYGLFVP